MRRGLNSVLLGCLLAQQFPNLYSYPDQDKLSETGGLTFDFIVVGGGTGGCAVAARLAESGKHTVLLIEAGGLPNPDLEIPAHTSRYTNDPNTVKSYHSVPQLNAGLAFNNGVTEYKIGKMLGGTSGVNGMYLNRGSPHDYNNWAKLTGDESWNYDNMLKYFQKYENYSGDYPSDQRGFNGPISIERPNYAPGLSEWFAGARELGYQIGEPNGPQILSFSGIDFAHKHGRRVSSYTGYIEPMLHRSSSKSFSFGIGRLNDNLHILINTEVNRIIFEGNRAVGVKFTSNSTHVGYASATKEIVVSAGVMDSPTLLLRSGIGPKSVLESARVPAIKYLPVGRNLHDQVGTSVPTVLGNRSVFIPERDLNPATWRMFNEIGDGPYTSYVGAGGQAFLGSSALSSYEKRLGWPDIHLIPFNGKLPRLFGSGGEAGRIEEWEAFVSWASLTSRPKSRGTVTLNPRDIDDSPVIDFQYLTHPDDIRAVVDGIKVYTTLCENTSAFRRLGCRVLPTPFPACSHLRFRSDPYWKCFVRQTAATSYHAVGTCRMGSGPEDPQAVVDSQLRVIGIEGLTVADASVMPAVINANPQGAVYAIAEKAADMILNQWKLEEKASKLQLGWGQ